MAFDGRPRHSSDNSLEAQRYLEVSFARSRFAAQQSRCCLDIVYGEDQSQQLDLYRPAIDVTPHPVLIFWHGGGFVSGGRENMGFLAPVITALPAILVAPSYRLCPAVNRAAQLDDCLAALAWTYRSIERYGGDPQRIFVGGHSAGGWLAVNQVLDSSGRQRYDLPDGLIKGCCPVSAPLDPLPQEIGAAVVPAFFLCWGERDLPAVTSSNPAFARIAAAAGNHVMTHVFKKMDHFEANLAQGELGNAWASSVSAIMRPHTQSDLGHRVLR